MNQDVTVYIVDDDPGIRKSLSWLLQSVNVRAQLYSTAAEFLAAFDPGQPSCLLSDIRMPGMSGLDLQRELVARGVTLPIVFLTGHGDVPSAARAFRAGALDFLEKPFSDQQLLDSVRDAMNKARTSFAGVQRRNQIRERLSKLSPREREVLQHVALGKPSKVIALELGISINTVENHRARVVKKTEAESLAELVLMAWESGMLDAAPKDEVLATLG